MSERASLVAVVAATVVAACLRLAQLPEPLIGDELSTLYLVDHRSVGDVLGRVSSDAEITPPLYFLLAWLATLLGDATWLIRLPSLLAGVAAVPLTFLVGVRLADRAVGAVASAIVAVSPTLIFYSGHARAYSLAVALLLISTLSMLMAVESRRAVWWAAYGLASALTVYSHYTAGLVLVGQLAWLLVVRRDLWRQALAASSLTALLFVPWVPGLIADIGSPTVRVLDFLLGGGPIVIRRAVTGWALGYGEFPPAQLPGFGIGILAVAGAVIAVAVAVGRAWRSRDPFPSARSWALTLILAAAAPLLMVAIELLGGPNLVSARNLVVSSAGLALLLGFAIVGAGPRVGPVAGVIVVGCLAVTTIRALTDESFRPPPYDDVAAVIRETSSSDEVIVDLSAVRLNTPVPITSIQSALGGGRPFFAPFMPPGEPPNRDVGSPQARSVLEAAFRRAAQTGAEIRLVGFAGPTRFGYDYWSVVGGRRPGVEIQDATGLPGSLVVVPFPRGYSVGTVKRVSGSASLILIRVDQRRAADSSMADIASAAAG